MGRSRRGGGAGGGGEEGRERRGGEDGLDTDNGDEYFSSLKARSRMTRKQRRPVLLFDIVRLPLI